MENKQNLQSNIWKLLLVALTHKRYYLPLLSVYFLTLPDATAQQIGLWAGIAYLAESLFELPSGYISDRIGHKKMIIFSKISMLVAVGVLIFATSLWSFIIAAVLTSLSWAALSGTQTAFLHNTVEALGNENEFTKINMRQQSYSALFGTILFIAVPLLVSISIRAPFVLSFVIDAIGLVVAFTLVNPPVQKYKDADPIPLWSIIGQLWQNNFFPIAIYIASIAGVMLASNRFLYPYLEELGMPLAYMGFIVAVIGVSQFVLGQVMSNHTYHIKLSYIFLTDILIFPLAFLVMALTGNYWIVVVAMVIRASYARVRRPFMQTFVLENFVHDKRYKATVLSVLGQVKVLMAAVIVFAISPVVGISYKMGFLIFGAGIFAVLFTTFVYIKIIRKKLSF